MFNKVHRTSKLSIHDMLNGTELALRVRGLGFESCRLHFLFIFNFIILLGTQTDRAVARVCQRQLNFLFNSKSAFGSVDRNALSDLLTFWNNLTSASEIVGYSTWARWVVSTNVMQFNEFEYRFACSRKVVHLCFIMSPGKMIFAVLELWLSVALTVSFKLISF